ncbi:MAG: nucleotidyl transferase AbiEii/AbiGii toxin family protein [Halodesulfurarchaeum sp.]|nr:nucleotidyl transferase AbiEii/AbiGii toxin family protein [Halodesulfurarchaeum sp.]
MLRRSQIESYARTFTNGNAGQAETLYLQDLVLSTISRETADQLVFKGGTALLKFYQLDRFSEDLDFTARVSIDDDALVRAVSRDLEAYGASPEETDIERENRSVQIRLGIQGPLYTGDRRSLNFLRLEINTESSIRSVDIKRYNPHFQDIPAFELSVLSEREILAEKIRALLTRDQPRDLYDIYHLLSKSVSIDPDVVGRKLEYYDRQYDPSAVLEAATELEIRWETLSPLVYSTLPEFTTVIDLLGEELRV